MSPQSGAERVRRWQQNHREEYLQYKRDAYQRRKKAGVCNQCGRPAGGKTVCPDCLDKRKKP